MLTVVLVSLLNGWFSVHLVGILSNTNIVLVKHFLQPRFVTVSQSIWWHSAVLTHTGWKGPFCTSMVFTVWFLGGKPFLVPNVLWFLKCFLGSYWKTCPDSSLFMSTGTSLENQLGRRASVVPTKIGLSISSVSRFQCIASVHSACFWSQWLLEVPSDWAIPILF